MPRNDSDTGRFGSQDEEQQTERGSDDRTHPDLTSQDEASREQPGGRTAADLAPGIPQGSGEAIDDALSTPDSDLGGAIAGDTTPRGDAPGKPSPKQIREEDRTRKTL